MSRARTRRGQPVTDALALGEKLVSLLHESARSSTYKPALLLALLDRAPEFLDEEGRVPVRALAERVVELYWPQTLAYPTTGSVLLQNQAGGQARIVRDVLDFRATQSATARALPQTLRDNRDWERLLMRVELTLAQWPIPRLQRPYSPFLYDFAWSWKDAGGWSAKSYSDGPRTLDLLPGVADALVSLGPLLRPFITRWWTDKAAQLNPSVEAARSLVTFEDFLFGRDRVALERVAESLLDLQQGNCFYCHRQTGRTREVDHFVPWSHSGDDGLDNLVAACPACNNDKRAALAGPEHLADLLRRNLRWDADLGAIAEEKRWPRDRWRSLAILRAGYLRAPAERPVWICRAPGVRVLETLAVSRASVRSMLGAA